MPTGADKKSLVSLAKGQEGGSRVERKLLDNSPLCSGPTPTLPARPSGEPRFHRCQAVARHNDPCSCGVGGLVESQDFHYRPLARRPHLHCGYSGVSHECSCHSQLGRYGRKPNWELERSPPPRSN